jgi:hypothetical protein
MKIGRPTFVKESQVYICQCKDEENIFRVESSIEGGKWTPALDTFLTNTREQMISMLLVETKGWFSKPLTREWLVSRLTYTIPTHETNEFEGICRWKFGKLSISKESFVCEFVLDEKLPTCIPLIDLQEEQPEPQPPPQPTESRPLDREEKKTLALRARTRAAMALLKAERLMQAYAEEFGEDTEWEEDETE